MRELASRGVRVPPVISEFRQGDSRSGEIEVYSPQSPLGSAIIGFKKGDTVTYEAPNGKELKVEIVDAVPFTG